MKMRTYRAFIVAVVDSLILCCQTEYRLRNLLLMVFDDPGLAELRSLTSYFCGTRNFGVLVDDGIKFNAVYSHCPYILVVNRPLWWNHPHNTHQGRNPYSVIKIDKHEFIHDFESRQRELY